MTTLVQTPAPGERAVRFVGDSLRIGLRAEQSGGWPAGWRAYFRTNLGRAAAARAEIIASVETCRPPTLASWRDLPLVREGEEWGLTLPLAEVGYFRGKAYAVDEKGWQHWPSGPDFGVSVQPAATRTANTVYCAFPRMFGPSREARETQGAALEGQLKEWDAAGYTVIPPSGKLRDVIRQLPHIFDTLGCRILHLLPVHPTPTTLARFGRFGSPYACEDLEAIDPALVEFDRCTTGIDQFRELTYAVHRRGGRVFLDIVVNHTGWGSVLQERHPDWFQRGADGCFVSPGAWGTIWEDLVELNHAHAELRQYLGEVLLEWCRRGVDGFRCDAGYQVPLPVWQHVTARVRQEYPDTVFLLEGLGGSWEATESLLTDGGMQWAYSELFQNYTGVAVAGYLDHALRQSRRVGLLVHYSETHDNARLAARGRAWSVSRNRLCALASVSGAFGFTCGVEWLAPEKVNVHSSRGLAWGQEPNLVEELGRLNRLLASHPCFFDGARLESLTNPASVVYGLLRISKEGRDAVLVLANTDPDAPQPVRLPAETLAAAGLSAREMVELLDQTPPEVRAEHGVWSLTLEPGAVYCLAAHPVPQGLAGDAYRQRKQREALALTVLAWHFPVERLGNLDTPALGEWFARDPVGFVGAAAAVPPETVTTAFGTAMKHAAGSYRALVVWERTDRNRVSLVPPHHWLIVRDTVPFRARLAISGEQHPRNVEAIATGDGYVACFAPSPVAGEARLDIERYAETESEVVGVLRFLGAMPSPMTALGCDAGQGLVLLTNGRGGMARLGVDFGAIRSKYDCLLGANLHPSIPVDRHVFAKRARVWVNADGFISPLDARNLTAVRAGNAGHWRFDAHAGDGRTVTIELTAWMAPGANTTVLQFHRPALGPKDVSPGVMQRMGEGESGAGGGVLGDVRLTVRVDVEDRNFHQETKRNPGAEHHFGQHCRVLPTVAGSDRNAVVGGSRVRLHRIGFEFAPAPDRRFRVWADAGSYHPQPEWSENVPHPVEQSRGQTWGGDAFSPGWFELPMAPGSWVTLVATAEVADPDATALTPPDGEGAEVVEADKAAGFAATLTRAARAYVVRRDDGRTVVAGYPWFLDWGRDTLICARGLLAAGWTEEVTQLLRVFGRFEEGGTLPNTIHGADASNRDTSDAPLWYGVVCEELGELDPAVYDLRVGSGSRTLRDVLGSIAAGYLGGTRNGIGVDPASGLVWSPSHFTWMDTNYPAGTPREGYPLEIQALWIRLLRQLDRIGFPAAGEPWSRLAQRALESFERLFWLEAEGFHADVLIASRGQPATRATPHRALRCNEVFAVALGLVTGDRARRSVAAVQRHLLVPGALRSLAPLPVSPPLPIRGPGGLLNDPDRPYWGRYEGDEDSRRKPAYHNGTAWTWPFPSFCEALVRAWDNAPDAVAAARAYLGSADRLLAEGCVGHLPEVLDGDAPHAQRGCDAQAWGVTETLRVWRWLENLTGT
jgi:predicted glycogen debranching enzyme